MEQFERSALQEIANVVNEPDLFEVVSCSLDELVGRMDPAGVGTALVPSLQFGNHDHPGAPIDIFVGTVREACETYPERFEGLYGIDPTAGMDGVREFERAVEEDRFIGAMAVPYGFGLPPNHRRYK